MKTLALILAILLASSAPLRVTADPIVVPAQTDQVEARPIPNDCAILATEVFARIRPTGCWVKVLHLTIMLNKLFLIGHAVTVWQLEPNGPILVYDNTLFHGTIVLPISSRDPKAISAALAAGAPSTINILGGNFYEL